MEITLVDGIKDGHKYELVLLRKRIAEVRIWVQNLDYEHRISFLVPDP